MNFLGRIVPNPSTELNEDPWIALIREHQNLCPVPPHTGINPFSKEPTVFTAPATSAHIVCSEQQIGGIAWSQDESTLLIVHALEQQHHDRVLDIARSIATALDCSFVP